MRRSLAVVITFLGAHALLSCGGGEREPPRHGIGKRVGAPPVPLPDIPEAPPSGAAGPEGGTGAGFLPASTFKGTVLGMELRIREAVFVSGAFVVGSEIPTVAVLFSDAPNLCEILQRDGMPRGSTLFGLAFVDPSGNPIATGDYVVPDGFPSSVSAMGTFNRFDAECHATLDTQRGMTRGGLARLARLVPGEQAVGSFSVRVGLQEDAVSGIFRAAFCDAPGFFADYMRLLDLSVDADHCFDATAS
jgi:hypothetical protein